MLSEEEKAIQFYKRFIEAEEQELEWMYKEDEEYYRDSIKQKELLIKGWRNILNLITKQQKENEKYKYLYQKALDNTIKSDRENIELKKENEELKATINKQSLDISNNLLELQQKDKQIDLMADKLVEAHEWFYSEFDNFTKEDFIKYFASLVEKE